jgi:hypothetical protein
MRWCVPRDDSVAVCPDREVARLRVEADAIPVVANDRPSRFAQGDNAGTAQRTAASRRERQRALSRGDASRRCAQTSKPALDRAQRLESSLVRPAARDVPPVASGAIEGASPNELQCHQRSLRAELGESRAFAQLLSDAPTFRVHRLNIVETDHPRQRICRTCRTTPLMQPLCEEFAFFLAEGCVNHLVGFELPPPVPAPPAFSKPRTAQPI